MRLHPSVIGSLLTALVASTVLVHPAVATDAAMTGSTSARSKPTIVLVHGAWSDSSSWSKVAKRLTRQGHHVLAPPNPLRRPSTDIAYLEAFLDERTRGPVVLVGHSYGGGVISGVDDPDVQALVYINAFIPAEGESTFQLAAEKPGSHLAGDPATVFNTVHYPGAPEGDVDLYVKRKVFIKAFGNDLPRRTAATLAVTQRPLTLSGGLEPAGPPSWTTTPSWSLIGKRDNVIPRAQQRAMSSRAGAKTIKVKAGHLSMLSKPRAVTALIDRAAGR
jgi:pimeloyl-ACP methyl ester carboxylesterase